MTRSAEQNRKMRDERREKIFHEALRLFAAKGLHATRVSDIAEKADMSQGLLYRYFDSKEAIFTELIRNAFRLMNEAARGLEAMDITPREKIQTAVIQLLRGIDEGQEFAYTVLFNAQAGVSPDTPREAQKILRKESSVAYGVIERILRAGQEDGSIKLQYDPAELAVMFWTAIKGLALHKAVYGDGYKSPDPKILMSMFFTHDDVE